MAKEIHYEDEAKQKAHDAVDLMAMEQELNLTCEAVEKLQTPVVWSHNDLLSGNVLVTHQASPILQPTSHEGLPCKTGHGPNGHALGAASTLLLQLSKILH